MSAEPPTCPRRPGSTLARRRLRVPRCTYAPRALPPWTGSLGYGLQYTPSCARLPSATTTATEGAEASVIAARDLTEPLNNGPPHMQGQLEPTRSERHICVMSAFPVDTSGGLAAMDCIICCPVNAPGCSFPIANRTEFRAQTCEWLDEKHTKTLWTCGTAQQTWPESQAHRRCSF